VPESNADTSDERIDNDLLQVAAMLAELKINDAQVEQVIRLGKKSSGDDAISKPRPMKIVLDSDKSKQRVIRNAKKLEEQGCRLGNRVCPRRLDTQAKRSSKCTSSGTETQNYSRREKLDHL